MYDKQRTLRWFTVALVHVLALAAIAAPARADTAPTGGTAEGTFDVTSFTIEPYRTLPSGATLNRFHADDVFHGDLRGSGSAEAWMLSRPDGSTRHIGFIKFTGSLGGRSGSFVIRTVGGSTDNAAGATWTVVSGSGTGELTGLRGHGGESAVNDGGWIATYHLTYHFK